MTSYRQWLLRLGRSRVGTTVRDTLGPARVRTLSRLALPTRRPRLNARDVLAIVRTRRLPVDEAGVERTRAGWVSTDSAWQPQQLRDDNLARTASALEEAGVPYTVLRTDSATRHALAVAGRDRSSMLAALAGAPGLRAARVQEVEGARVRGRALPVPAVSSHSWPRARVVRVFRLVRSAPGAYTVGELYGCDIELWDEGPATGVAEVMALAPRPNVASDVLPAGALDDTEPVEIGGRSYRRPRIFSQDMLEDVAFDIDLVYTWVDGDDPAWRERMLRTRARLDGVELHPESASANRFTSRDELRYSLRSLQAYAPWVRHVWLVTDQQVPSWLADETPGLTVVDHRDIVDDPAVLPLFNSNAIISRLHHIPGLAEHYLYLNDDMFFGHDVQPNAFFHPSGIARLFPARLHRPFGPSSPGDEPHVNISRNIRDLLEDRFGTTITRAIRHTPYPQIRSRQGELEALFPEVYAEVLQHPFRHHADIAADQLLHYYLQIVGAGVPSAISYDYVNVGVAEEQHRLRRLLLERDRAVFCLNDAPSPGAEPVSDAVVQAFLAAYFPVPSSWEVPAV